MSMNHRMPPQEMGSLSQADDRTFLLSGSKRKREPTVFAPGHRIRMNIVPMFLMIFIPYGMFVLISGITSFYVMYARPYVAYSVIAFFMLFFLAALGLAINRRKHDPEPTWFCYFAIVTGIAVFGGIALGADIYNTFSFPYYQVRDLKVLSNIDANAEHGQNVMDAGLLYFAESNKIDAMRSWHFKQKTVYCVAPITKGYPAVPETQSFDFWAVGKDCCSTSASDFRCGDYSNPQAKGGIRNLNDADQAMYRLAVEQATALYGIISEHPVFFEWSADPKEHIEAWNQQGFSRYIAVTSFMLVLFFFLMSMATCAFSFLGRAESVYGENILNDPNWAKGGIQKQKDFGFHQLQPNNNNLAADYANVNL